MTPKISVIVPVYNADKYLEECLKSILNQTYTDFELILVNDGSTDNSGILCDRYQAEDDRIIVIHISNGGVSNARNIALKKAKGDFVCFVDSDDVVDPDYLMIFMNNLNTEINLYIQQMIIINSKGLSKSMSYQRLGILSIVDALQINSLCAHGYACGKLYRTSLIRDNDLKFDEQVRFSEDLLFVLQYLLHSDRILYLENHGYHYYLRNENASNKIYPVDAELFCFNAYKNILQKLSNKYKFDVFAIRNVTEVYAMLFARVRNSIYNSFSNLFSKERLTFFRNLSEQELTIIYNNRHISNFIIQKAYWLLKNRQYRLFDFFVRNALFVQKMKL